MSAKGVILAVLLLAVAVVWAMSKVKSVERSRSQFKTWYPEK